MLFCHFLQHESKGWPYRLGEILGDWHDEHRSFQGILAADRGAKRLIGIWCYFLSWRYRLACWINVLHCLVRVGWSIAVIAILVTCLEYLLCTLFLTYRCISGCTRGDLCHTMKSSCPLEFHFITYLKRLFYWLKHVFVTPSYIEVVTTPQNAKEVQSDGYLVLLVCWIIVPQRYCKLKHCCCLAHESKTMSWRQMTGVCHIQEKWSSITFDTVLLDHYWLPDSVVWLNKGYMVRG